MPFTTGQTREELRECTTAIAIAVRVGAVSISVSGVAAQSRSRFSSQIRGKESGFRIWSPRWGEVVTLVATIYNCFCAQGGYRGEVVELCERVAWADGERDGNGVLLTGRTGMMVMASVTKLAEFLVPA